ncbi:uncharacterized protein [Amphiura filiformis]|uniref:uncharacterized protein n=1 Tax=Amphiura filiformis TaxID=82378 RepID=UPI003B20C446
MKPANTKHMGDLLLHEIAQSRDSSAPKILPWIADALDISKSHLTDRGSMAKSSSMLLADVTSLMLLSAAAGKFSESESSFDDNPELIAATNSAVDLIMNTMNQLSPSCVKGTKPQPNDLPRSASTVKRKLVPDKDLAVHLEETNEFMDMLENSQSSEYMSCMMESSSDIEVFQSCESHIATTPDYSHHSVSSRRTLDSGVGSPVSYVLRSPNDPNPRNDLKEKVQMMKQYIDKQLKETLSQQEILTSSDEREPSEDESTQIGGANPLVSDHLDQIKQRYMGDTSTNDTGSMHKLLIERALASSVLIIENNKLSQEVGNLKKQLEVLQKRQMQMDQSKLAPSDSDAQTSPDPACLMLSDYEDESDFGGLCSSARVHLLPNQSGPVNAETPCNGQQSCQWSVVSTPPSSARRKLEVPSPLRASNYLSINSEDELDEDDEIKIFNPSTMFCCPEIVRWCRTI